MDLNEEISKNEVDKKEFYTMTIEALKNIAMDFSKMKENVNLIIEESYNSYQMEKEQYQSKKEQYMLETKAEEEKRMAFVRRRKKTTTINGREKTKTYRKNSC